ncbi:hypothetical protein CL617_00265 [archaeon]|nr:hypothetical protein [archaeon]|tara:strand:- start:5323 stop:5901 length:579 start_codon:yes stop_codon:yes gene_type:complete
MAKTRKIEKISKKKKKEWFEILASKEFKEVSIGETVSFSSENLIGRTIYANLASLTNDSRMQNVRAKLVINEVKNGKAHTKFEGYEILPAFIKRVVKVGKDKIDDSFEYKTKDEQKVVLKPLLVTKNKVNRTVTNKLRMGVRKLLNENISKMEYDELVYSLISYKVQKELKNSMRKIYPLDVAEIRVMKLVK